MHPSIHLFIMRPPLSLPPQLAFSFFSLSLVANERLVLQANVKVFTSFHVFFHPLTPPPSLSLSSCLCKDEFHDAVTVKLYSLLPPPLFPLSVSWSRFLLLRGVQCPPYPFALAPVPSLGGGLPPFFFCSLWCFSNVSNEQQLSSSLSCSSSVNLLLAFVSLHVFFCRSGCDDVRTLILSS